MVSRPRALGRKLKCQTSMTIASAIMFVIASLFSFVTAYALPVLVLSLCAATGLFVMRKKGASGQTELILSLALIALTAGSVVAYGAYNGTGSMSFTGDFAADIIQNDTQEPPGMAVEAASPIEVFADTRIELAYDNVSETLIAYLFLDDGTPLANQDVEFFTDGVSLGTAPTDSSGMASMEYVLPAGTDGGKTMKADFAGYDYLNPSSAEIQIHVSISPQNQTVPEIKIEKIEFPDSVNVSEEFEIKVFATSLRGNSTNATFDISFPPFFSAESTEQQVAEIIENETLMISWVVRADACGNYELSVAAETREGSKDSAIADIRVICKPFDLSLNETLKLGHLEITVFNISEDSYETFEWDENYERTEQKYYRVYIGVFNNFSRISGIYGLKDNEVIEILLEDNVGNFYSQDKEIPFFLDPSNLFGNYMEILPTSSREGYLIFPETIGAPEKLIVQIKSEAEAEFGLA